MTYYLKESLLNGTAVACAASSTTVVSNPIPVGAEESLRCCARILFSALAQTTAISCKLEESYDAINWEAVGSESSVSVVKKTFAGGVGEVTDITWPSTAAASQGDYVSGTTPAGVTFAVWLDIDAAGAAPTGAIYLAATNKIKVSIVTGGTAPQNAALARTAVLANAAWAANFTTSVVTSATFTATQKNGGVVADFAPKSTDDLGAGSVVISVTTAGTAGGVNTSTDLVTSTSHGFVTGQKILYVASTLALGGLTTNTLYWAVVSDGNTLGFATSYANAIAGTLIDLTTEGTGASQAIYQAEYEIRMIIDDTTDSAQLPLLPVARIIVVTGTSDTATVSSALFSRRKS